jgi:hypothetical protein
MKRFSPILIIIVIALAAAIWWFSPKQVVKRRTATLLRTLTLESGTGKAGRQMGVYSLNALLAKDVTLENPTIQEANGTFDREELGSAFSWICEQAKQTKFELISVQAIEVEGTRAEISFSLNALAEMPNYRPADGEYDVVFRWLNDETEGWRLTRAQWKEAGK